MEEEEEGASAKALYRFFARGSDRAGEREEEVVEEEQVQRGNCKMEQGQEEAGEASIPPPLQTPLVAGRRC